MTGQIIKQEFFKIARRRGMFRTGVILTVLLVAIIVIANLVEHGNHPERYNGGADLLHDMSNSVLLVGAIFGILIGAQTGSWDFANGTFRYMTMTGRPRMLLYFVRVPAVLAAVFLLIAPATAIGFISALVMPLGGEPSIDGGAIADYFWEIIATIGTYTLVSLGIGSLLRSGGAAIAVALVTNLIGLNLLTVLHSVDETLGDLMLPEVLSRVTGSDTGISAALAALALVVWIAAFLAAGALRTQRAEY